MAGTDQSVNLTGMLSQIGESLGSMGEGYGEALSDNITRISMPKLDMSDPDSIDAYTNWGVKSGQVTPGQAAQYGWLSTKARSEQKSQQRIDGLNAYKATNQKLNTLKTQRAAAETAGNTTAVVNLDELIVGTENAVTQQLALLEQDPVTADALYKEKQREQQQALWQRQAARAAEIEQTNARNEEITGRSNNLTQAMLSGVLDISALEPLPADASDTERAANAQKRAQIAAVQQGDLESYEHALGRYTKAKKDQKVVADKVDADVIIGDDQLIEIGLTDSQITNYKAMLQEFGRERAGNWAMKQLTANQAINAKTDTTYKWTDDTSKQWMKTTSDIMSDIVMSTMDGDTPTGIGATLANMSDDGRNDLAARVLNRLRSSGTTPTEESAGAAIRGILEDRQASRGKKAPADPIVEQNWFSKLLSGGAGIPGGAGVQPEAPAPTVAEEAVEYTPSQQNTIARAMEISQGKMTRSEVIQRLKANGKL
jgi:hypothetical protein